MSSEADDFIRSRRERRRPPRAPEAEETKPLPPLVTQGGRGQMPRRQITVDEAIRNARRGGGSPWTPIL